jgi:hypothetical protein
VKWTPEIIKLIKTKRLYFKQPICNPLVLLFLQCDFEAILSQFQEREFIDAQQKVGYNYFLRYLTILASNAKIVSLIKLTILASNAKIVVC